MIYVRDRLSEWQCDSVQDSVLDLVSIPSPFDHIDMPRVRPPYTAPYHSINKGVIAKKNQCAHVLRAGCT